MEWKDPLTTGFTWNNNNGARDEMRLQDCIPKKYCPDKIVERKIFLSGLRSKFGVTPVVSSAIGDGILSLYPNGEIRIGTNDTTMEFSENAAQFNDILVQYSNTYKEPKMIPEFDVLSKLSSLFELIPNKKAEESQTSIQLELAETRKELAETRKELAEVKAIVKEMHLTIKGIQDAFLSESNQ